MLFGTIFLGKGLFLRYNYFCKRLVFHYTKQYKNPVIRNAMDNRKLYQKDQSFKSIKNKIILFRTFVFNSLAMQDFKVLPQPLTHM